MKSGNTIRIKPGETPAVYVDVDGTLLLWPGGKAGRILRPDEKRQANSPVVNEPLVDALRKWHRGGKFLAFWSRGGTKRCQEAAQLCGLMPDACLPKPRIAVEDSPRTVTAGWGFMVVNPTGSLKELLLL